MVPWRVESAKVLPGYRLEVTFAHGLHGILKLSNVPHVGVFARDDPDFFELVRVA